MPITIDGSNGISDVRSTTDGSASTPAIRGTDTNTGIFFPAADTIAFAEGGAEVARFDSSGNLGIGVTSPAVEMVLFKNTSNPRFQIQNSTSGTTNVDGLQVALVGSDGYLWNFENGNSIFGTNATERMRIDSSGNVIVGGTQVLSVSRITSYTSANCHLATRNTAAASGRFWRYEVDSGNTIYIINQDSNGVYISNGGTSWTGLSDERLKTDLTPINDAINKVLTLRAVTGRFKTDEENVSRSFLIAQDVQAVLPEAVDVRDDEQGTLGIRYTETIPLLVAAIKEQQAIITEQANAITALEARLTALEQA